MKTEVTTAKLTAPLLGDVIREAETIGNERIVFLAKMIVDVAKDAGFNNDSPMTQVMNFLRTPEHQQGAKVQ